MRLHPQHIVKYQILFKLRSHCSVSFAVSHRRSLFSRWSRMAHLPTIPLDIQEHNIQSWNSVILWGTDTNKLTRIKQVIYLLSCQARLTHRSDETHQALKCFRHCVERMYEWIELEKVNVSYEDVLLFLPWVQHFLWFRALPAGTNTISYFFLKKIIIIPNSLLLFFSF